MAFEYSQAEEMASKLHINKCLEQIGRIDKDG